MRRAVVALVVVAVLVVAVVLLAGRGDEGGGADTEAELSRILQEDRGLRPAVADCVAAQAFARLTEEELDSLRERGPEDELSPELRRKLEAAVTPCASAGS